MTVGVGQSLSHYTLLEEIGRGGMGVVYRAQDLRLKRDVAVKVLPAGSLADPAARKQFRKEAHALSRLNHPNIQTVHDYDTVDAVDFLVTEFVAGVSLDEKLDGGPLEEAEIARLGRHLAEGLEAAHAAGLVHRDLKPGNIMVTPEGRLKILDFGLARTVAGGGEASATVSLTDSFAFAGTLPYMAPEQVDGNPLDARTDIWAAGVILFEMATGRRPFTGDTPAGVVVAIKTLPPPPPERFRPRLSRRLRDIILKCLEKDPGRRYQTARELRVDLLRLDGPDVEPSTAPRRRWPVWLAGAAALAVAAAAGIRVWNPLAPAGDPRSFDSPRLSPLVTWASMDTGPRVSPDGRWIVFLSDHGGREALWRKETSGGAPLLVDDAEGILSYTWSADGTRLCVHTYEAGANYLKAIPAAGGPPLASRELGSDLGSVELVRWTDDGIFLESHVRGLVRLDLDGAGPDVILPRTTPQGSNLEFDVAADGRRAVYVRRAGQTWNIREGALDGTPDRALTAGGGRQELYSLPRYLGSAGRFVAAVSNRGGQSDIWILDTRSAPGAPPRQITASAGHKSGLGVSGDGSLLVFSLHELEGGLRLQGPQAGSRTLTSNVLPEFWPEPAGSTVFFQRSRPLEESYLDVVNTEIYRVDAARDPPAEPELVSAEGCMIAASPDARWLAYAQKSEAEKCWILRAQDLRSGRGRTVVRNFAIPELSMDPIGRFSHNQAWGRDGTLYFTASLPDRGVRTLQAWSAARPEDEPRVLLETQPGEVVENIRVSPSGARLAWVRRRVNPPGAADVEVLDGDGRPVTWHRWTPEAGESRAVLAGWVDEEHLVLVRGRPLADWSYELSVSLVGVAGAAPAGRVPRGFTVDAVVDHPRRRVLVVGIDDTGRHNLFAVDLDGGGLRRLTNEDEEGVSVAGFGVLEDGTLVYSRMKQGADVWGVRLSAPPPPASE